MSTPVVFPKHCGQNMAVVEYLGSFVVLLNVRVSSGAQRPRGYLRTSEGIEVFRSCILLVGTLWC